ncbi:MAG: DUF4743 domain-containing protein [Rhodospirillales bacterium]
MSFLDRISECPAPDLSACRSFKVDGLDLGWVKADFAQSLGEFTDVFRVTDGSVELAEGLKGFDSRTGAIDGALRVLAGRGVIKDWRDEFFPVGESFAEPALFNMDRSAVPLFGVWAYGVHVNGYIEDGDGLKMWIGRRSLDKPTAPGKLDQIVAGGQPAGISLKENLIKECQEEASIPSDVVNRAVPVGGISYATERPEGLRRDVLFNYDLELPSDFQPVNTDGEIAEFYLWPIERVMEVVRDTDEFKFNCAMVVIDFLIRRGYIEPDHPQYVELLSGLHR